MTHKQYKTYTLWLLIITITALVVTAAMLSLKRAAAAQPAAAPPAAPAPEEPGIAYYTPNPASSQENSETVENSGQPEYLVTLYQGRLGVFKEGRTSPVLTQDTPVYLLPEEDIELLKKGLPAKDLNEARKILEDYD